MRVEHKIGGFTQNNFFKTGERQVVKKSLLLGLLAVVAVVCQLNAQTSSTDLFTSNSNLGFNLAPMQGQYPGYDPEAIRSNAMGQVMGPMMAGLQNMAGGWWSWAHGDIFGGALTAGLEGGGLIMTIVGFAMMPTAELEDMGPFGLAFGGVGVFTVGMIFGMFRGMGEYKKQNAVAAGFNGNPLKHVSFGVVPGVGGSLIYSTLF
jgi:hypothetical protein